MELETQIAVLAIVLIVAIGAATVLPSLADSDTSTGNFTLNNSPPTIISFTLYEADCTNTTDTMDPQTEYALKIDISDNNTLNDISEIKVILKTNSTSTSVLDNATDKATYNWTPSGGGPTEGWSLVGPSNNSTWAVTASSEKPDDLSATTGTWWLHFKPGKVARETIDDNSRWDIYVKVTDNGGLTTEDIECVCNMSWYGEISALNKSYSFGSINLSDTNKSISSPDDGNIDVKTISNGNYKIQGKSEDWEDGNGNTAVLDSDGNLDSGEFALRASSQSDVGSSNLVSTSYANIPGYNNVNGPTAETGAINPIYQWVSVASSGLPPGTYEGNFSVLISNA